MNGSQNYFELLAPETVLIVGASIILLLGHARWAVLRRYVPVVALASFVIAAGITWQYGAAHIGRELTGVRIDELVTFIRLIACATGVLLLLVNWHQVGESERGEFLAMLLFSTAGLTLTAAATDLLVLFLAVELVSVPLYVMVALSSPTIRATEATFKYFFLGALAAALMVYGFSFVYGAAGTTVMFGSLSPNISDYVASHATYSNTLLLGLVLAFGGLAFKMTAVPFHFYAADVYQGAASSVTAVLGFLPKAAGLIAVAKLFAALGWRLPSELFWLWWVIAAVTMTVGNTLALLQSNLKRLLAYSGIAHSGYMLMGLLVGPAAATGTHGLQDGMAAVLFYITIYAIMNTGAFAVLAYLKARGREAEELSDVAGLARTEPVAALVVALSMFSLMGMPLTAGFWGKLFLFSGALSVDPSSPHATAFIVLVVIAAINSAVGAAYYLRVIATCFLAEPKTTLTVPDRPWLRLGLAICGVFVLGFGVWPRELLRVARVAGEGMGASSLMATPPHGEDATLVAEHLRDGTSQSDQIEISDAAAALSGGAPRG